MRFFPSRRVLALFAAALCTPLVLCGCSAQPGTNGQSSVSSLLAGAGRSIGAARAYDRLVRTSGNLSDAYQLNARGYLLADKGKKQEQFVEAEALTRRSLEILNEHINFYRAYSSTRPALTALLAEMQFHRANVRDSVAWALFRQKRYKDALTEQERAVAEAISIRQRRLIPQADLNRSLVELHFHLGEIYRALGRFDDARTQYQLAQRADAKHALSAEALRKLPPSEAVPLRKTPPGKTEPQGNALAVAFKF